MSPEAIVAIGSAMASLAMLAHVAYKAGKQEQRIAQLENWRDADDATFKEYRAEESKRFEGLQRVVTEVKEAIIRLESKQEAYFTHASGD